MSKDTAKCVEVQESRADVMTEILRQGAQRMLAQAIEAEVAEYIERHVNERDDKAQRMVVRNGHRKAREIQTGLGSIQVRPPRVNDRRVDGDGQPIRFTSRILPPYLRRTRSIEELIPWLYLKGISTGDFSEALAALLGPNAPGLSATTITRLKSVWEKDYAQWNRRDLTGKHYVYIWVDGIHFNIRLEQDRQCILVVMGATADGKKELVGVQDGYRESEQSWKELLLDLKARGLSLDPKLATGDGALGFWAALPKVYSKTREQRCWVHKTANVLNNMPKSLRATAKAKLQNIWMAESKAEANKAFDLFLEIYQAKYPKATGCLAKDRDVLLTFYEFPAEHWIHIRSTNPIESTFATVRLRTKKTKGCGSRIACLTMVFKLAKCAEKNWRRLRGYKLLGKIIEGAKFKDGIIEDAA